MAVNTFGRDLTVEDRTKILLRPNDHQTVSDIRDVVKRDPDMPGGFEIADGWEDHGWSNEGFWIYSKMICLEGSDLMRVQASREDYQPTNSKSICLVWSDERNVLSGLFAQDVRRMRPDGMIDSFYIADSFKFL